MNLSSSPSERERVTSALHLCGSTLLALYKKYEKKKKMPWTYSYISSPFCWVRHNLDLGINSQRTDLNQRLEHSQITIGLELNKSISGKSHNIELCDLPVLIQVADQM